VTVAFEGETHGSITIPSFVMNVSFVNNILRGTVKKKKERKENREKRKQKGKYTKKKRKTASFNIFHGILF
jgi:hypothetical protein